MAKIEKIDGKVQNIKPGWKKFLTIYKNYTSKQAIFIIINSFFHPETKNSYIYFEGTIL